MPPRSDGAPLRASFFRVLGAPILVLLAAGPVAAEPSDWPMEGRDPPHAATAAGPAPPYRQAWIAPVEGGTLAGPVIAGDRVVVVGRRSVAAFDAASGEPVWDEPRTPGPAGPAAIVKESVVYASGHGEEATLIARDLADGSPGWRTPTGATVQGGITAEGDRLYAGTLDGTVLALDAVEGEVPWRFDLPGAVASAPAVDEGLVVVTAQDADALTSTISAINTETGKEEWRFASQAFTPGATAATIGGGIAFAGMGDARVHAFDLETGAERWAVRARAASVGTPFFFTSFQTPADPGDPIVPDVAHVSRLDAGTGEEIWAYRFTGLVSGTGPAVAGGSVLIGDGGGTVWAVDLESGVAVWRQRVGQRAVGAIAADGERIYAVTVGPEGRVIALEHDPEGSLVRIPSATTLFPLQALLNFAAAAALVGLVSVAMARYLLKPRERPESGERS